MDLKYQYYGDELTDGVQTPLVILHGMFGMGENWHGIAQELAKNRPVWTIDLPGHGHSYNAGDPSASYRYADLAQALADCLRNLQKQIPGRSDSKFIVCGHSMGAKTAMALSLLYPALVQAFIAVDSGPIDYRNRGFNDEVLKMLAEMPLEEYQDRMAASQAMANWVPDPALRGFLLKSLRKNSDGNLRWRFDVRGLLSGAPDIADWPLALENVQAFNGPALFLAGALSDYVRLPQDVKIIRDYFPKARIEQIPEARHWVHVDNRGVFMMHLSEFLLTIE